MAASPAFSWAQILDQADSTAPQAGGRASAEVLLLKPDYNQTVNGGEMSAHYVGDVEDWTTVLDIVNGMGGTTTELRQRLKEQTAQHENVMRDLKKDLGCIQEHVRALEQQAKNAKAQSEIRLQEIQILADAEVEKIRADAEVRLNILLSNSETKLRQVEARLQASEVRADTAEKWLVRISEAAKRQLLGA